MSDSPGASVALSAAIQLVSSSASPRLHSASLIILPLYLLLTLVIGWLARRRDFSANAWLNASRSLPLWIVTAAFLAANCGALEIVGLSALAAQYGVAAFDFYFIGAIPAMVFLAIWMMPVYRRSNVRTVPEYLELRYGPSLRLLNACVLAMTVLLLAGISLYAMAQVLLVVLGFSFVASTLVSAAVVLGYVLLGGVRATIFNEVLQLTVMLAGLVPLAVRSFRAATPPPGTSSTHWHLWLGMPVASRAASLDIFGIVFGLGFVLSFGYWCTDFVLMQRAFTARTDIAARQVPLLAGFGKLFFAFIVVVPGLAASRLLPGLGGTAQRFDQALPTLMTSTYGPWMLGLGFTALVASLMSGLAANVSAFAAIWTEDIYRSRLVRNRRDRHYLRIGRFAAMAAIVISLATCYIDFLFGSLMEHVQLIFSVFGSPFFAIFLLGMGTRRTTERGAIAGFVAGSSVSLLHLIATAFGWLHYGSIMNANFHAAIYAFTTAIVVGLLVSALAPANASPPATGLVFHWRTGFEGDNRLLWTLAALLLAACAALNWIWR